MGVEQQYAHIHTSTLLKAILDEFSAITDYRTLRDSLPRRLASLLKCRCVLFYQRIGETLQFASGSFDDIPGWSVALLSVAHINPIDLNSDTLEANAWRSRHPIISPSDNPPIRIAAPVIYRQSAIGVLVAMRDGDADSQEHADNGLASYEHPAVPHTPDGENAPQTTPSSPHWSHDQVQMIEAIAGIVALLLENTRLLERDRTRIHELSLLNSISSQMSYSMHEAERIQSIIIQRTKEISGADLCELIIPDDSHSPHPAQADATSVAAFTEFRRRQYQLPMPYAPIDTPSPHSDATQEDTTQLQDSKWLTPTMRQMLIEHFSRWSEEKPLVIERPGDMKTVEWLKQLPSNIKTFFAIPLIKSQRSSKRGYRPGIIVGGYRHAWKLRHEELVLLQVLASQASTVLENIQLMEEVVEARNEARNLFRQVLDDQRLKSLILESIPSGLITVDVHGCITTFNYAAEGILGYRAYEVLGQPLQRILALESLPMVMQRGKAYSEICETIGQKGHEVVLDIEILPLRNDRGGQIGAMATFSDVTSVRHLEEEKRRLDRLVSLGEMAASVAHEVRNPLASIKTSMQMLMDDVESGEANTDLFSEGIQDSASVVLKEVERLDAIVRELLQFARPRQLHCVACDMTELSNHVLRMIQPQCAKAAIVVHRVYHDIPFVWVDTGQMEQVLFNLYMNAIQAMPDGGVLTISCHVIAANHDTYLPPTVSQEQQNGGSSPRSVVVPLADTKSPASGWLELSVSDTGIGIRPTDLDRTFQPFFTTKAHGIGLGLAITRRLVEDHSGHIRVESQFGYGATFSVRLPLTAQQEENSFGEKEEAER